MLGHLTPEIKIGEIRLLFNSPAFREKKICLVEGVSDLKLFRNIAKGSNLVYESINGRKDLITVMKAISQHYSTRLYAICDSDFLRLSNDDSLRDFNILMTDHHDSEMLMLNSNALLAFIDEHVENKFIEQANARILSSCLEASYKIGLLRWINDVENLSLKFKGLNFSSFTTSHEMELDVNIEVLIELVLARSKAKPEFVDKEFLINKISEYASKQPCLLQLCCGHDVSNMLATIMKNNNISRSNLSFDAVESNLRLAYSRVEFIETQLYGDMIDMWQKLDIEDTAA